MTGQSVSRSGLRAGAAPAGAVGARPVRPQDCPSLGGPALPDGPRLVVEHPGGCGTRRLAGALRRRRFGEERYLCTHVSILQRGCDSQYSQHKSVVPIAPQVASPITMRTAVRSTLKTIDN